MAEKPVTLQTISEKSYTPQKFSRYFGDLAKRSFDITASFLGLLFLAPLFGIVALAIKRDSPGPVFYRGRRTGLDGKTFHILKFRTMYETPDSYLGPKVTAHDDPRVTPVGRWLRDTKLNELPQFWNVLMGEMSLVGPRPEDPEIVKTWPEGVRQEVLSVRPGVTSPASVQFRNEESLLSSGHVMYTYMDQIIPSKLRLDQLYVRNRSLWLDLDILFWTILVLLPKLRTYNPPEDFLFLGPISRLMLRYLNWFTADTLITFLAFGVVGVIWRLTGPLNVGWLKAIGVSLGFSVLFSLTGAVLGVNRIAWSKAVATDVFYLMPAAILAAAISYWLNHIADVFPNELVMVASAVATGGFITARYRGRLITGITERLLKLGDASRTARERVLIIGGGLSGQLTAWLLDHPRISKGLHLVGFVDDDLYKQGSRFCGADVLGKRVDIPSLVEKHDIGLLIFAIHNISRNERNAILEICNTTPAKVVIVPDILSILDNIALPTQTDPGLPLFENAGDKAVYSNGSLPCRQCLLRYAPAKMALWLTDLERFVQAGDLDLVQAHIRLFLEQNQLED